jgi:hypothetical protein
VAVGRANKNDVADILAAVIDEPSANGKTFEMITLQVRNGHLFMYSRNLYSSS